MASAGLSAAMLRPPVPHSKTAVPVVATHDAPSSRMVEVIQAVKRAIQDSGAGTYTGLMKVISDKLAAPGDVDVQGGREILLDQLRAEAPGDRCMQVVKSTLTAACDSLIRAVQAGPDVVVNNVLSFIRASSVVMVHGSGQTVVHCVANAIAKREGARFLVVESQHNGSGEELVRRVARQLAALPAAERPEWLAPDRCRETLREAMKIVPDSAVASVMPDVSFVLTGAYAVTEHGGLVHSTGTFQLSLISKALGIPFYVATQTFKFTRIFPLSTRDLYGDSGALEAPHFAGGLAGSMLDLTVQDYESPGGRASVGISNRPSADASETGLDAAAEFPASAFIPGPVELVPPASITFMFTEKGIMPPSAAADEMASFRFASK